MVLGIGSTYGAYSAITAAAGPPTGTHYPMTMAQQSAVSLRQTADSGTSAVAPVRLNRGRQLLFSPVGPPARY